MSAIVEPLRLIINTRISDLRPEDLGDGTDPGSAVTSKRGDTLAYDGDNKEDGKRYLGPGLTDQEADCRQLATSIGARMGRPVEIVEVIPEPNISAYKRRKVTLPDGSTAMRVYRPGLRKTLDMLAANLADGAVWLDLDRAFRDPRDLEDLIDVVEASYPRKIIESVTGSLRLATDSDIAMARVMVAIAHKSSRDTARRVRRAKQRQAEQGKFGGGGRPFGFEADGTTLRPDEAEEIFEASKAVLGNAGVKGLAMDLRQRNVPSVTGAKWTAQVLRKILLRPRNAGLMVYRADTSDRTGPYRENEIIGVAPWDPIVPPDMWRAVVAKLTDPDRTISPGNTPRWLGSALYLCCKCGAGLSVDSSCGVGRQKTRSSRLKPRYVCNSTSHVVRNVAYTDRFVREVIVERLSRPDAVDLIATTPDVDIPALRSEIEVLHQRLKDLAEDFAGEYITRTQMRAGSVKIRNRVKDLQQRLNEATSLSPLTPLIESDDVGAHFDGLSLAVQRAVLDELMTVIVLPSRKGAGFDRGSILIVPNEPRDDFPERLAVAA